MFFRAIRRLPWVKLLWLDAPRKLRLAFTRQELDQLVQVSRTLMCCSHLFFFVFVLFSFCFLPRTTLA